MKFRVIAAGLLVVAGFSGNCYAAAPRTEGLNLELTPYVWGAGMDGKLKRGVYSTNFNYSFSDLVDKVDAGFMGLAIVSYDRFVLYTDYDYIGLNDSGKANGGLLPAGTKVKGDLTLQIGTYAVGYRFDTFGENTIDVLVGAQLTDLNTKLQIQTVATNLDTKDNLTDTVVMLRPSFQISEKWRFNPTLTYGISGDSDATYVMMPQVQYDFSKSFALRLGYKRQHWKLENGSKNTPSYSQKDITLSGPFLGVGWTFP